MLQVQNGHHSTYLSTDILQQQLGLILKTETIPQYRTASPLLCDSLITIQLSLESDRHPPAGARVFEISCVR